MSTQFDQSNQYQSSVIPATATPVAAPKKGLAIGALAAGIASFFFWFTIITTPLAVILGIIAIKRANNNSSEYGGKGFAVAGIICGVLAGALFFLLALLFAMGTINL